MKKEFQAGLIMLVLSTLACEPMFVIGWKEIFFVFFLIAFLIGPPVYRLIRKIENSRRQKNK